MISMILNAIVVTLLLGAAGLFMLIALCASCYLITRPACAPSMVPGRQEQATCLKVCLST